MSQSTTPAMIAQLNDQFRRGDRTLGIFNATVSVANLPPERLAAITTAIADFDDFNPDNDPYGEHDLGFIELDGDRYIWKIDYLDRDLKYLSKDPADPRLTRRVMNIMFANEY
ncbi:DUF3768 domain-containing protein [Pseudanabaena minima]|uniref:DUF3768 domain-containing protein n=1 Tax=Pseudanabaena minima TaxID=890415 RepID=UPI003DA928A4